MQILIERFLGHAAVDTASAATADEKRFLSNIFSEKNFEKQNFFLPLAADPLPGLIYYTFILLVGSFKQQKLKKT